jgi:hypothetical protein
MIKEIKYGGITTTPSDYDSPDGDLASSSGIVKEEGRILVTRTPTQAYPATDALDKKPLFIHNTTDGNVFYILMGSNSSPYSNLYYRQDSGNSDTQIDGAPNGEPKNIDAIGNTLVCLYDDGSIHYVIYRNGAYIHKGTHIPTVEIQFGLNGVLKRKMIDNLEMGDVFDGAEEADLSIKAGYEDYVTNRVLGEVESALTEYGDKDDKFSAPFLVRYALRLYDGSYTNISVPVLMDNNFGKAPVVSFWARGESTKLKSFAVYNVYSTLTALLVNSRNVLNGWEDIVKSIDIFVSRQFRNYDHLGKVGGLIPYYGNTFSDQDSHYSDSPLAYALSTNKWMGYITPPLRPDYVKDSYYLEYSNYFTDSNLSGTMTRPRYQFDLPYYSEDELVGEQRGLITLNSTFYKLYSFKLEKGGAPDNYYENTSLSLGTVIPVESGIIANIETQDTLQDDYYSNDTLLSYSSFVYNSRISFANIARKPFGGFSAKALNVPFYDGTSHTAIIVYNVLIDENGTKSRVQTSYQTDEVVLDSGNKYYGLLPTYFFYPNPNAKTLVVKVTLDGGTPVYKEIGLSQHPSLNGAYYISRDPLDLSSSVSENVMNPYPLNTAIPYPSQIYTSEAYNPYVFKAENINQLPISADIINIASTTQPMSQGQFGQYPLYVFSDMGIFALQLASNGNFSGLTPVTRDVILGDGSSLTQLDDSLLFATKQGIMELVGKNTKCITKGLDKKIAIPSLDSIGEITCDDEDPPVVPVPDIKTFINGCKMVYDYVNARVIVFNPEYKLAYVYAAKDDAWTMMPVEGLIDTINAYPDAYAVASVTDGVGTTYSLVDLSTITDPQTEVTTPPYGWLITRPFSMDSPNDFKFIDVIRQNGVFEEYLIKDGDEYNGKDKITEGDNVIRQILYGSNDLINWFIVGSSDSRLLNGRTSSPFKWFRLAVGCTFKHGESLSSFTVSYRIKTDNPHLF